MSQRNPFLILISVLAALALVAAACGDDDDAAVGLGGDGTADETSEPGDEAALPVADDQSPPPAAGACLEGTVDCNDTPGDLGPPLLEPGDEGVQPTTGVLADGGLSPEEALSRGPGDGIVAVTGFILDDATGTYLCGALAESYPPQCGAGAIELEGFALETVAAPVTVAEGVTWTDTVVSVFGVVDNGVMTVDETATG